MPETLSPTVRLAAMAEVNGGEPTSRLRAGDWTCATHGRVTPATDGVVPACPQCGAMVLQVRMHQLGYPEFVEPRPEHCAGSEQHRFGPGRVHLGFHACHCPSVVAADDRGHRTWMCLICHDIQEWPSHQETAEAIDWPAG
jgi:hypothetical protein